MKVPDIRTPLIHKVLGDLNDVEGIYVHHTVGMSQRMKHVVAEFKVTPAEFCTNMGISASGGQAAVLKRYTKFINGGTGFDLMTIAKFEAFHAALIIDRATTNAGEESKAVKV